MRGNFIGGQSATGGAGQLSLSAVSGLALPSNAFVGGQLIEYSIVEYTDATLASVAKAESGWGEISSGNVLTRSAPRTAWDGSTYNNANPSPLSFGTSNVRVYVSPIAEGGPTAVPRMLDGTANYGPHNYMAPGNVVAQNDLSTGGSIYENGKVTLSAALLRAGFPISSVGLAVTTAVAGGVLHVGLATIRMSDGLPGQILLGATFDLSTTGFQTQSVGPVMVPPGWYYQCFQTEASGASIRGFDMQTSSFLGNIDGNRVVRFMRRVRTMAPFVAGDDLGSQLSLSWSQVNNAAAPFFCVR